MEVCSVVIGATGQNLLGKREKPMSQTDKRKERAGPQRTGGDKEGGGALQRNKSVCQREIMVENIQNRLTKIQDEIMTDQLGKNAV